MKLVKPVVNLSLVFLVLNYEAINAIVARNSSIFFVLTSLLSKLGRVAFFPKTKSFLLSESKEELQSSFDVD